MRPDQFRRTAVTAGDSCGLAGVFVISVIGKSVGVEST
jgi:hypothetical protein